MTKVKVVVELEYVVENEEDHGRLLDALEKDGSDPISELEDRIYAEVETLLDCVQRMDFTIEVEVDEDTHVEAAYRLEEGYVRRVDVT